VPAFLEIKPFRIFPFGHSEIVSDFGLRISSLKRQCLLGSIPAFSGPPMNSSQMPKSQANASDDPTFISGLRQALALNHTRMLDVAKNYWERKYAGKDPSDACVSVRITAGKTKKAPLPCGGILKRKRRRLLS
jgi:hypothetical protein